jgi:hypothetical protein
LTGRKCSYGFIIYPVFFFFYHGLCATCNHWHPYIRYLSSFPSPLALLFCQSNIEFTSLWSSEVSFVSSPEYAFRSGGNLAIAIAAIHMSPIASTKDLHSTTKATTLAAPVALATYPQENPLIII